MFRVFRGPLGILNVIAQNIEVTDLGYRRILFMRLPFIAACFLLSTVAASHCCAQKPWKQKPRAEKIEDDYVRAGQPWELRRWAQPTYTPSYDYGYVGGGAAFRWGQPRTLEEGTWGRDYVGMLYPRRVWLNWWHGARYQGGTGGYATDGPKVIGK